MRKFYYIVGFMIIALLAVKIIFIIRAKDYQVNQYSDLLSKQIYLCNSNIEDTWSKFENDLNYLRNYETISILLNNRSKNQIDKFELFFSKYIDLIEQINIYSSSGNTFAIYKDENNLFHSQFSFSDTKENTLEDKERVILYEQEYFYNLPVFSKNKLYANILFTIDFENFILKRFKEHEIGYAGWQGLIDNKGNILVSNDIEKIFRTEDLTLISKNLNKGTDGFIDHYISFKDDEIKMLSIYKEVNFIKNKFGIIFSVQTNKIFYSYYKSFISSLIVGILLLFLLIAAGVFMIKFNNRQVSIQNKSIKKFENILESLPIGVLVTDKNKKVSMANMAAINMLHMENQSEVVGQNISNKLINAKNHISKDTREYNFDANKYIYYDKTGEEIVLYKKEIPLSFDNQNLSLEGFIDISPIEKARKLEIAANNSKSEFLAKMTHE
ncbi:MAG: PAS domain-containing protein, partial [Bacteroidales bacterium]|nr:PAS domain-containing protein [Bacteroidales bacterium]